MQKSSGTLNPISHHAGRPENMKRVDGHPLRHVRSRERRRDHRLSGRLADTFDRDPGLALAHFQLGESGDGGSLLRGARFHAPGPGFEEAAALFIAEEQEHARLLACLVRRFGGDQSVIGRGLPIAGTDARRKLSLPLAQMKY